MARNVTITFADGSQKLYQNVPDNVTPGTVIARATKDFPGQRITTINGGKSASTQPTRNAPSVPVQTRQQQIQAAAKASLDSQHTGSGWLDDLIDAKNAALSGVNSATFGLPNHIAAAARTYVPGLRNGNSYSDNVDLANEVSRQAGSRAPVTNALANVGTSLATGKAELGAGKAVLARAGASGLPVVAKTANFLQRAIPMTVAAKGAPIINRVGAGAANVARSVATGAAVGGAQAAGTGDDVGTGAETGAIAGGATHGVAAIGKAVLRPAADILGLTNAGQYIRRFTNAPMSQIQARADAFRQATGAEPSLFELLPLADRNSLAKHVVGKNDATIEQASSLAQTRASNIAPEMQASVQAATNPQRALSQTQMENDLAAARGGQGDPVPHDDDHILAARAARSPTDLQALRSQESRLIMAPHDNKTVVNNFSDLHPQYPELVTPPPVTRPVLGADGTPLTDANGQPYTQTHTPQPFTQSVMGDPEISAALRSAGGTLQAREPGQPITVGEVTDMISRLRDVAHQGGNEGLNAGRAAEHLLGVIDENVPEAGAATAQMRSAFAARSRQAEGMAAGYKGDLRDSIQVGTNGARGNTVQNAFDTPQGVDGRQLGQTNRLVDDLADPAAGINTTEKLATGDTRNLPQNLGQNAADQITGAAQAQTDSANALSSLSKAGSGDTGANGIDLGHSLLALSPHTFAVTKIGALKKLQSMSFIPRQAASDIVDRLFSQNPETTNATINLLNGSHQGRTFLQTLAPSVVAGSAGANAVASPGGQDLPDDTPAPAQTPADAAPQADPSAPPAPPPAPSGGYPLLTTNAPVDPSQSPYMPALQHIYDHDNPDFLNFVESHQKQESGGQQYDKNGNPLTSKAGAIGLMQLEPGTAKDAAKRAGVPYDPIALKYDPAYNKLLGATHVAHLLNVYNGDKQKAAAAYNAGEGNVNKAIDANGNLNLAALPQETQNYVPAVAG